MRFKEYISEMTKYTRQQKDNLSHVILNVLMDPNAAKLLKKVERAYEDDDITITKQEAKSILANLKLIRQIILELPIEEQRKKR